MDLDAKAAGVEVDLVFEGAVRAAPAIAWEVSHSERVFVGVHLKVCAPDVRPNEVLEVKVMCSQEKSGCAWKERPWHLR